MAFKSALCYHKAGIEEKILLLAVRKLGFDFRLYDCHHTFATRELENSTDLLTLAAILGHSNLDELQRYAHVSEARKREVATRKDKGQAKAV